MESKTDLERVWAEVRRADQAGQPHTGKSLGAKFGKSVSWGSHRLTEFRTSEGEVSQAQVHKRERKSELEPVWEELRRADQAGQPHSGATLSVKFHKGLRWGEKRLSEFREREGGTGLAEVAKREREAELERVWAELRRVRDAGESHTGESLGKAFNKSGSWGLKRLSEFRQLEGGTGRAEALKRDRERAFAELRRADGAGEPHSGKSLAAKFGKSRSWGDQRLGGWCRTGS